MPSPTLADLTDEQFRAHVRRWLADNLSPDMVRRSATTVHPTKEDMLDVTAVLARVGWSVPHWPIEHGGPGWSPRRCLILEEELGLAGGSANNIQGVSLAGPVIAEFGTPEQKARYLPAIREGREFWSQGFSEPNSGSDLASLRTRAVRHGDVYVVDGQKIWTSQAMYADMLFCLVRTDAQAKPQAGISFLLIDMRSPGITVRPIPSIDEGESLCEVFFESVQVPVTNLIGEEGRGWTYAKWLLEKERVQTAEVPRNKLYLARLKTLASKAWRDGRPLADDPLFAQQMAQAEIDLLALQAAVEMTLDIGDRDALLPSALKIIGCELMQRQLGLQVETLGPYGALWYPHTGHGDTAPQPGPDDAVGVTAEFLFRRAATIYGGSSEIQKNIIAKLLFNGQEGGKLPLSGDQRLLADSAQRFGEQRAAMRSVRPRGAVPDADAAARAWRQWLDTGLLALALPEALGGAGGGLEDLAVVGETLGAQVADVPFAGLGVVTTQCLVALAADQPHYAPAMASWVEPMLTGATVIVLADESPADGAAPLRAHRVDRRWQLQGTACLVDGGAFADRLLVIAQTDAGQTAFIVDAAAAGVRRIAGRTIDTRAVADVVFERVIVPDDARLGDPGAAGPAWRQARDIGRVMACADAVGAMGQAFRITRDYLVVRRQFGAPLASFQALQHRMAELFAQWGGARAMLRQGVAALRSSEDERRRGVAACRSRVGRAALAIAHQSVQLHGGIGMTEECAIGRYYKRLLAFEFGDGGHDAHTRRFAQRPSAG